MLVSVFVFPVFPLFLGAFSDEGICTRRTGSEMEKVVVVYSYLQEGTKNLTNARGKNGTPQFSLYSNRSSARGNTRNKSTEFGVSIETKGEQERGCRLNNSSTSLEWVCF